MEKPEFTCEPCTCIKTKFGGQTPHIYKRVSAYSPGMDNKRTIITWDDNLGEFQNHERAALEYLKKHFPECKLRKVAHSHEFGYSFGVYYSSDQVSSDTEARGVSVPVQPDRTALFSDNEEHELFHL